MSKLINRTSSTEVGSIVRPSGVVRRMIQRVSFALVAMFAALGLAAGPAAAVDTPEQAEVKTQVTSSFDSITDLLTTTLVPALFALVGIALLIAVGVKYAKKARGAAA